MVENTDCPRLCGGTFLTLLLQRKKRNINTGKPLANSLYLRGLFDFCDDLFVKQFTGASASTTTSKYKSCESENTGSLNIFGDKNIETLNKKINNSYGELLKKVQNYINTFLVCEPDDPWLVYALVELIAADEYIPENYFIYYAADGTAHTKQSLLELNEICVPALIVGVWHYILERKIENRVGRNTFISWTDESPTINGERPFKSDIGKNSKRPLTVSFYAEAVESDHKGEERESTYEELLSQGIVPEITAQSANNVYLVESSLLKQNCDLITDYLEKLKEKYGKLKTLLYNDEPKSFYSFYVCNKLRKKYYIAEERGTYSYDVYSDITPEKIADISNYIIISGTGGLGKSMMMRHLILSAVAAFDDTCKIPILVNLKDYSSDQEFEGFVFEKAYTIGLEFNNEEFEGLAKNGNIYFFLDGYDEVSSKDRQTFDMELEKFTDRFSDCLFVISSRPAMSFVSLSRFSVMELCEFSIKEAVELICKLEFRPDEPSIKENFKNELQKTLYKTHREFIGNPLLLTIMLMTYERFANVPYKMHIFYREAYETLATKHDATKGAYKRVLNTKLNTDAFEKYLAEFCARTYKEETFEFYDRDIQTGFEMLNEVKKNKPSFSYIEFRDDLTNNLCLLYKEGDIYQFIHRSFQEYFCALYFSRQKDRNLYKIGQFFNYRWGRSHTDQTFAMLYDMIPEKIEEYIFLPYLEDLFDKCDSENGYWTFLEDVYSYFNYFHGQVDSLYSNKARQYLYQFIIETYGLEDNEIGEADLPYEESFVISEYAYVNNSWFDKEAEEYWELQEKDSIDECYIDAFGEPETVGANLEVSIQDILEEPEMWSEFIEAMEAERFPVLREYKNVRRFYIELKKEIEKKRNTSSDDLFELFD